MKEFSHPGTDSKTNIDLNKAIESTITVARNEWKYVAEMVMDLDSNLPLVPCLPAEINQVILNMIINASHAIADVPEEKRIGEERDHHYNYPHQEQFGRGQHQRYRRRDF